MLPLAPAYTHDVEESPQGGNWTPAAAQVHDFLEPDSDVEDSGDALNRSRSFSGERGSAIGGEGGQTTGTLTPAYRATLKPAYRADLGSSSHFESPPEFGRSPLFSAAAAARAGTADLSSSGGGAHSSSSASAMQAWPSTGPYADASHRVNAKRGHGETALGVKYIGDARRLERYRISMGYSLLRGGKDGGPKSKFDTAAIKKHFMDNRGGGLGERANAGKKRSPLGTAAMLEPIRNGWIQKSLIWVCVPEGDDAVFYSHVGKIHRFHHSSFVSGGDVLGAGEWVVEDGKLRTVAAVSGHYQPTLTSLLTCIRIIVSKHGNDFDVLLFNRRAGWEAVPARELGHGADLSGYVAFPADPGVA